MSLQTVEYHKKCIEELTGSECVIILKDKVDEVLRLLTQEQILAVVQKHAPGCIRSSDRNRELVNLRKIYCLLAKTSGYSLREIGDFLSGMDHTTVIHNIENAKNHLETEPEFQRLYNRVIQSILETYSFN